MHTSIGSPARRGSNRRINYTDSAETGDGTDAIEEGVHLDIEESFQESIEEAALVALVEGEEEAGVEVKAGNAHAGVFWAFLLSLPIWCGIAAVVVWLVGR